jgi:hypothetical protein
MIAPERTDSTARDTARARWLLWAAFGMVGSAAGARLASILACPAARPCVTLAGICLAAPLLTGLADLYLRFHTP